MNKRFFSFFSFLVFSLAFLAMGMGLATAAPTPTAVPEPKPDTAVAQSGQAPAATNTLLPPPAVPTACQSTTSSFGTAANLPIVDLQTITSTITVSGLDTYLWDVNMTANMTHTFSADLEIFLISPAGTEVTISTDNGGGNDNVFANTVWDDQWTGASVGDYPYVNLTAVPAMSPEEAMGAFIGEDPNGDWQLVIHDDATDDQGTLFTWELNLTTLTHTPGVKTSINYGYGTQMNTPIPDLGQLSSDIIVPNEIIYDMNLYLNIGHTFNSDLDIYLISPAGITLTVTTDNGFGNDNVFTGTGWDDRAGITNPPGPVSDATFTNNTTQDVLVVENALAALNGTDAGGTWTLVIADDAAGETGIFYFWSINIVTASCEGDAKVNQQAYPFPAPIGGPIRYGIIASNSGFQPLANITLTDTLPVSTTFHSLTAAPGWTCQTPPVGGTGQVVCTTPTLAAGAIVTHYLNLNPTEQVPYLILNNFAQISTTSPEIGDGNNTRSEAHYMGLASANGNMWDVADPYFASWDSEDNGGIADGGQDAFDNWGGLRLRVADQTNTILTNDAYMDDMGMAYSGGRTWNSQPKTLSDVTVQRQLFATGYANYVRYLDRFTNESAAVRNVYVAWGGDLGSDSSTTLAATSSGNLAFEAADVWAVTIENPLFDPMGQAGDPPVGYLWRGQGDTTYQNTGDFNSNPFDTVWTGNGNDYLAYTYHLVLQPGETAYLVYYLYRGLAEGIAGPGNSNEGYSCAANCVVPPIGSETALAKTTLAQLAADPDFCGIPAEVMDKVANWPNATASCTAGYGIYLPFIRR